MGPLTETFRNAVKKAKADPAQAAATATSTSADSHPDQSTSSGGSFPYPNPPLLPGAAGQVNNLFPVDIWHVDFFGEQDGNDRPPHKHVLNHSPPKRQRSAPQLRRSFPPDRYVLPPPHPPPQNPAANGLAQGYYTGYTQHYSQQRDMKRQRPAHEQSDDFQNKRFRPSPLPVNRSQPNFKQQQDYQYFRGGASDWHQP